MKCLYYHRVKNSRTMGDHHVTVSRINFLLLATLLLSLETCMQCQVMKKN